MLLYRSLSPVVVLALAVLVAAACADTESLMGPEEAPSLAKGGKGKPTQITKCGYTITDPGKYMVAKDLTNCPAVGIEVSSSGVSLHLQGHTIDGRGKRGQGAGIAVRGVEDVQILGPGTVQQFHPGIAFQGVTGSSVHNVTVTRNRQGLAYNRNVKAGLRSSDNRFMSNSFIDNRFHGVTINGGDEGTFRGNRSEGNGQAGYLIFDGNGNDLRGNSASGNGSGFVATARTADNIIQGNTSLNNRNVDMRDGHNHCQANTWKGNTFDTANPKCIR